MTRYLNFFLEGGRVREVYPSLPSSSLSSLSLPPFSPCLPSTWYIWSQEWLLLRMSYVTASHPFLCLKPQTGWQGDKKQFCGRLCEASPQINSKSSGLCCWQDIHFLTTEHLSHVREWKFMLRTHDKASISQPQNTWTMWEGWKFMPWTGNENHALWLSVTNCSLMVDSVRCLVAIKSTTAS